MAPSWLNEYGVYSHETPEALTRKDHVLKIHRPTQKKAGGYSYPGMFRVHLNKKFFQVSPTDKVLWYYETVPGLTYLRYCLEIVPETEILKLPDWKLNSLKKLMLIQGKYFHATIPRDFVMHFRTTESPKYMRCTESPTNPNIYWLEWIYDEIKPGDRRSKNYRSPIIIQSKTDLFKAEDIPDSKIIWD